MSNRVARVLIPRPDIDRLFYAVPPEITVTPGSIVEIELRRETIWGVVCAVTDSVPEELAGIGLKSIRRTAGYAGLFSNPAETLFLEWLADYYLYPFPKIVKQIFAPFVSGPRGTLVQAAPVPAEPVIPKPAVLNQEQAAVASVIEIRWKAGDHKPVLLYGVTGSGKSEVYAALCRTVFAAGRQVLFLVPEVSLTSGTLKHLETRIGVKGVLLHSYMTPKKRREAFHAALNGTAPLIVGTRSALLYPFPGIGLIIVDEEHDASYKNLEPPYYHARDAAVMKARMLDLPVLLGSATPSSESWHNALEKKYYLERLPNRANNKPLPPVHTFPYRGDLYLPTPLVEAVRGGIEKKEQALVFINRRGFATIAQCRDCEAIQKCPRCEVALTYHKRRGGLFCHHCGYTAMPDRCSACGSYRISLEGTGIEKMVETLGSFFQGASIVSIDRDSLPGEKELMQSLKAIETGEHDIIAGTVMVSKGHNFPRLTRVIIKFADYLLNFADYRAAERCFQVITQVAGRAGRFEDSGEVWAEAACPAHYIWSHLTAHDYEGFMAEELRWRYELELPPFRRLILVRVTGPQEEPVAKAADAAYQLLLSELAAAQSAGKASLNLPVVPPLHRVQNRFRRIIAVMASSHALVRPALRLLAAQKQPHGVAITFDIDAITSF